MTTSEPTTGEITTRLYGWIAKAGHQERCRDELIAINRLESQAREIERLGELITIPLADRCTECAGETEREIAALTARAEQAEAREMAIIESLRDRCEFCIGYELEERDDPCSTCYNARTFDPDDIPRTKNWTLRGLPQEGEGL